MRLGFFDLDSRYQELEKLGDPLPKFAELVDWESFGPLLDRIRKKGRKNASGRKSYDVVLIIKILFLLLPSR